MFITNLQELFNSVFPVRILKEMDITVETGVFGAMMDVQLINNGPVTIIIDTEERR